MTRSHRQSERWIVDAWHLLTCFSRVYYALRGSDRRDIVDFLLTCTRSWCQRPLWLTIISDHHQLCLSVFAACSSSCNFAMSRCSVRFCFASAISAVSWLITVRFTSRQHAILLRSSWLRCQRVALFEPVSSLSMQRTVVRYFAGTDMQMSSYVLSLCKHTRTRTHTLVLCNCPFFCSYSTLTHDV